MPFYKNINIGDIKNITVMVNENISIRHAFRLNNRIHIAFSDSKKVEQDTLVEFNDNSSLCNDSSISHIDLIIDTDAKHLDLLIKSLLNIRKNIKNKNNEQK